jgi:hypothetical protein
LGLRARDSGLDSWDNLKQLQPGQKIEVVDMKLKSLKGTFVSFSAEAISLRVMSAEVSVKRPDVMRVSLRENSKRTRNLLIGLGIGAAGGLAAGVGLMEREPGYAGAVAGTTVLFAVVGAGLGVPFPGYQTIYRVKRSSAATTP